jgi:hypothetical protein
MCRADVDDLNDWICDDTDWICDETGVICDVTDGICGFRSRDQISRDQNQLFSWAQNYSQNCSGNQNSEQTYCRKWILDKMPKMVLGNNGKKYLKIIDLVQNADFFSF